MSGSELGMKSAPRVPATPGLPAGAARPAWAVAVPCSRSNDSLGCWKWVACMSWGGWEGD